MNKRFGGRLFYFLVTMFGVTFLIYFAFFALKHRGGNLFLPGEIIKGYFQWWLGLLRFDLGLSLKDHRPVLSKILERFPATLELNVASLVFSFLISIPLAFWVIHKDKKTWEYSFSFITMVLFSLPSFWIALVLSIFLGFQLGEITQAWFGFQFRFPISGMRSLEVALNSGAFTWWQRFTDRLFHLILPVICSSLFNIALIYKFFYNELRRIMNREYITAARARGTSELRVVLLHAGKNAVFPLLTVFSLLIPGLLSSNFIIETVFSWPGIGRLGYDAIMARDYPLVMGLALFTTMIVIGTNLGIELAYFYFNPMLREAKD
ncbi:MAG: ABC transporter permease [Candidatus Wallbacteria bacterium]|nr:ABC transporter permease [Candidatus Wallbacteria bacterium]